MSAYIKAQQPRHPTATHRNPMGPPPAAFRSHRDATLIMNPWENSALEHHYAAENAQASLGQQRRSNMDPVIYPGLYCPSGFDMMSILLKVMSRPNPKVHLGPIDCSVALLLCDLAQPDTPIVYVSEPFTQLTGYTEAEVLGKNCRFLQAPGGKVSKSSSRTHADERVVRKMRKAVEGRDEIQTEVLNFKKDGTPFINLLAMIPVAWDGPEYRYCVGFQAERDA